MDRAADGIGTAGSRFLDTVTTNEALHEGTAKAFEMGGDVMGYTGNRIVRDIATDIALGKIGKAAGTLPRIGPLLKTGMDVAQHNKKYLDAFNDFSELPQEMHKLGDKLRRTGKDTKNVNRFNNGRQVSCLPVNCNGAEPCLTSFSASN